MKRIFYILIFLFSTSFFAQDVVLWDLSYDKQDKNLEIKATIKEGWHLYSQHVDNSVGPVPTSFMFNISDDFQLFGEVIEPSPIKKYDENFEATLDFFEKEVIFKQKINLKKNSIIETTVTFMVCNETMCLPPVDKTIKLEINKQSL